MDNLGIIFEFIEGQSLDKMISSGIEISFGLIWMKELIEGMVWLHSKRIVHKDLKPSNLMISHRGLIIVDLGIAALASEQEGKYQVLTETFHRKGGTP